MTTGIQRFRCLAALAFTFGVGAPAAGQGDGGEAASASARQVAPVDLTGYWVSYVSKEWRFRMVTPARGDLSGEFGGIPLNADARRVAEEWDPAQDEASGEACKAYGAAGIMRVPGRLHITWEDDDTLRVDTDSGMQTRYFRFGAEPSGGRGATWQGDSSARWVLPVDLRGRVAAPASRSAAAEIGARLGSLEIVTRNMRPGYLRKNGIPYSEQTVMTEYWDVFKEPDGTDWLVITTTIEDPKYLRGPYYTLPALKREPDGSKWDPSPCSAR